MPKDQVEEVKQKTDIVSVIGGYVDLKKAGRNFKAPCPFHSEKLPSFVVSPELQIYKCFGCGVSGDVFTFLQEYEGMDFYESLKVLAEKAGVKLKPISGIKGSQKQKLFEINNHVKRFYSYVLLNHKKGEQALKYLKGERKMKLSTIKEFELGYCPNEPFALQSYMVNKKGYSVKDLIDAGIAVKTQRGVIDRFRGRVIFPLFDHRGNVIGFAGRIMPGSRSDIAKYINSPETPVYHKSEVLYGLNISRKSIKNKKWAIIVEGELDMISSWQEGIKNTIAIKGSAITNEQVRLLSRYANKVILALDSDIAGNAAAMRGIKVLQKEEFEIRVAKLVRYKDPDDYLHSDPEGYKKNLKKAKNVWDFLIESVFEKFDADSGRGKAQISHEVIPILASITDNIVQAHYVTLVANKLNVDEKAVIKQVEKTDTETVDSEMKNEEEETGKTRRQLLEERLIALSFKNDIALLRDKEVVSLIKSYLPKKIVDKFIEFEEKNNKFDPLEFATFIPKELFTSYSDMLLKEESDIDVSQGLEDEKEEVKLIVNELEKLNLKEDLEGLASEIKKLESEGGNESKLRKLQKKFGSLSKKYTKLRQEE